MSDLREVPTIREAHEAVFNRMRDSLLPNSVEWTKNRDALVALLAAVESEVVRREREKRDDLKGYLIIGFFILGCALIISNAGWWVFWGVLILITVEE